VHLRSATGDKDIGMPSFLQLPGNVPWWLLLIAIIPVGLYVLLFLAMPFSAFGVKSRLEAIEARLDDMHADIRSVALMQSSHARRDDDADSNAFTQAPPPIPPLRSAGAGETRQATGADTAPRRATSSAGGRAEPRLDWPK
jgi:hypothetical protein